MQDDESTSSSRQDSVFAQNMRYETIAIVIRQFELNENQRSIGASTALTSLSCNMVPDIHAMQ